MWPFIFGVDRVLSAVAVRDVERQEPSGESRFQPKSFRWTQPQEDGAEFIVLKDWQASSRLI